MHIDHHLQLAIIKKLTNSDTPVRYTDLKDKTIENSLFSFHLNKLIQRKMITKSDIGYTLTLDGARWLNDNGAVIETAEALRVNIALVIQNESGEYLIGQRTGQFKQTINDYMLATNYYTDETDIYTQISETINLFIPGTALIERTDFGFAQIKADYELNGVMRGLFCISVCKTNNFEPVQPHSRSEYEWITWSEITAIDHPSAEILRRIISHTQDPKNQHMTPLFAG